MSLILVATVGGVLLERCVVARRSGVWGYAGAERWTRSATVRGPLQPCSTSHCARRRVGPVAPSSVDDYRAVDVGAGLRRPVDESVLEVVPTMRRGAGLVARRVAQTSLFGAAPLPGDTDGAMDLVRPERRMPADDDTVLESLCPADTVERRPLDVEGRPGEGVGADGEPLVPDRTDDVSHGTDVREVASQSRHARGPRTAASTRAPASATGTSSRSPDFRSRTSIVPSASPRPTVTIVGIPSSSASLNFTPGDTFGRSSYRTVSPASTSSRASVSAASKIAGSLPVATTC